MSLASPTPSSSTLPDLGVGQTEEVSRCSDIWFHDGNLVLKVNSKLFRVHKSILSRQSSTFRDIILHIERRVDSNVYTIDGCPVVHLFGDDQESWYWILSTFVYNLQNVLVILFQCIFCHAK